jgi:sugar phosphate isomerase/epimerase
LNRHSLALDHLTVADTTPMTLVETAHATGCRAICLFMQPMEVLPRMPRFNLYDDVRAQHDLRSRMEALGISLDLAYPFTLAGRTDVDSFIPALDCAATLGAGAVNVLAYDRDPMRRVEKFGAFCDLAQARGLSVVVEFYPLSQVRNLAEAIALTTAIGRPGEVGVNVDLLHLIRSGGRLAEIAEAPAGSILYAQQCDGPASYDPTRWDFEASSERLLAGEGTFDLAGFGGALPADCPVSVELPQDDALAAGVPVLERARRAVDGVLAATGAA